MFRHNETEAESTEEEVEEEDNETASTCSTSTFCSSDDSSESTVLTHAYQVQFDPVVMVTEYYVTSSAENKSRLWYSASELNQFREQVAQKTREYMLQHPKQFLL